MTKLKCWKKNKENEFEWDSEKRPAILFIETFPFRKNKYVIKVRDKQFKAKEIGKSKTRDMAFKKAKSYMKKHDKC